MKRRYTRQALDSKYFSMQSIHEYIVEIPEAFRTSIKCGNVDLYLDPDFNRVEHSNRIGKVISAPLLDDTPIEPGDEVLIVQTLLMPHITDHGRFDSPFLVDKEKGYYRVEEDLIVVFRKPMEDWQTVGRHVMVEPTKLERQKEKGGLTYFEFEEKYSNVATVVYNNPTMLQQGIKAGDQVYVDTEYGHEYDLEGRKLWRMWTTHIFGKKIEDDGGELLQAELAHTD